MSFWVAVSDWPVDAEKRELVDDNLIDFQRCKEMIVQRASRILRLMVPSLLWCLGRIKAIQGLSWPTLGYSQWRPERLLLWIRLKMIPNISNVLRTEYLRNVRIKSIYFDEARLVRERTRDLMWRSNILRAKVLPFYLLSSLKWTMSKYIHSCHIHMNTLTSFPDFIG